MRAGATFELAATVTPVASARGQVDGGTVSFVDAEGATVAGCESVEVTSGDDGAVASCSGTLEHTGAQQVRAVYSGTDGCAAVPLADGQAVCETTFDATGEAQLTARFGGSELFTESVSAARTLKVTAAPKPVPSKVKTSISASSIPTSWRYGTAKTFTATISGAADRSGKLSLVVDGKTIKTVTLSKAGSAKFALTGTELTPGAHAVSLSYAGNASSLASSSTAVGRSVGKAKTVAKVSVSKQKTKKPKVTVRVTAGSATPTGNA